MSLGEGRRGGPRLLVAFLLGLLGLLALVGAGQPAGAQDDGEAEPTVIGGRIFNEHSADGERIREPVAEVRVVAATEAGEEVASGESDDEGFYEVVVPGGGTYVVSIDADSLPEGVAVDENANAFTKTLRDGGRTTQAFFLGEDLRDIKGKWSQLPQTLGNGLKLALIIAITSVGLSLVYGTIGLTNFAHGEMVTAGAIFAWVFNRELGIHLLIAAPLAIATSAAAAAAVELGLWKPLRRSKTSLTSMMIVSIGFALAVRYLILFLFGGRTESYGQYTVQRAEDRIEILGVANPPRTVWIMGLSVLVVVGLALFLLRTRFGKAIRAVSDNPDLAGSSGIDGDRVILIVWMLGGSLAGLGGVFYGLEYGVKWDMGFTVLLLMFAAIVLGGLGNPFGALVGSLVIGIFVELWTWIVPNANDLKNVGALIALIVLLLIRPQGLLGSKERIG